jgi:hypothetical protein
MMIKDQKPAWLHETQTVYGGDYTTQVLFRLGKVGVQSAGVSLQGLAVAPRNCSSNSKTTVCLAQPNGFLFWADDDRRREGSWGYIS